MISASTLNQKTLPKSGKYYNYIKQIKISSHGQQSINQIKYPKQKKILKFLDKQNKYIDISLLKDFAASYQQVCIKLAEKKLVNLRQEDLSLHNNNVKFAQKVKKHPKLF